MHCAYVMHTLSIFYTYDRVSESNLFNIYINSLLKSLQPDSPIAYADDVTLIAHARCFCCLGHKKFVVATWTDNNLMAIK